MTESRRDLHALIIDKIRRKEVDAEKAEKSAALWEEHGLPDQAKAIRSAFEAWGKK